MTERPDRNDDPADPFGGYNELGLYVFGPAGMRCALAALIANSLVRHIGRTAFGERRAWIRERAEQMRRRYSPVQLYAMEMERRQPRTMKLGRFHIPSGKRPTSGRKRRAA